MVPKQDAIIVKFDFSNDQTVGEKPGEDHTEQPFH